MEEEQEEQAQGWRQQQDTHERLIKYVCVCVKRKTETDMDAGQRFGLQLSSVQGVGEGGEGYLRVAWVQAKRRKRY